MTCEDGTLIEAAVVLDATGHSRRLVKYDKPFNPGYQIAYGIVAEVNDSSVVLLNWYQKQLKFSRRQFLRGSAELVPKAAFTEDSIMVIAFTGR